jgi:CBS domain-containing protein
MATTAADIMTKPVITAIPQASAAEIAELLSSRHISAIPICGPAGELVGIVSEDDILRPFRQSARLKRDWWLTVIASGEEPSQDYLDYLRRDTRVAADFMVRPVITAAESATLPELAETMIAHRVKRLPILRDGRLVGIVSRSDLVRAIAKAPAMLV